MRGKGEGSIHRRADGYWVASVEGGRYRNGGRRKLRAVRRYKRDAIAALDELRRQAHADVTVDWRRTVASFLEWWLTNVKATEIGETTLRQYRTRLGWIVPSIGHVRLAELRRHHVEQLKASLAGKDPSVAHQAVTLLRAALRWAVSNDLLVRNVADGVRTSVSVADKVALTDEEAEAVIATAERKQDRLLGLWEMNVRFGMRTSEVLALAWPDVDFDAETLTINGTKSTASARVVPLLPGARDVLLAHRKRQAAERLAAPVWHDDDSVFTDEAGRPLTGHQARREWNALCLRAGMGTAKKFTSARKLSVSKMFVARVPVEIAAAFHGHTVAVMQKYYLVLQEDDQRAELLKAFG